MNIEAKTKNKILMKKEFLHPVLKSSMLTKISILSPDTLQSLYERTNTKLVR